MSFFILLLYCLGIAYSMDSGQKLIKSTQKDEVFAGHPKGAYRTVRGMELKGARVDIDNVVATFSRKGKDRYTIKFEDIKKYLCGMSKNNHVKVFFCKNETDPGTEWTVEKGSNGTSALKVEGKCLRLSGYTNKKGFEGYYLGARTCNESDYSWKIISYITPGESESSEEEVVEKPVKPKVVEEISDESTDDNFIEKVIKPKIIDKAPLPVRGVVIKQPAKVIEEVPHDHVVSEEKVPLEQLVEKTPIRGSGARGAYNKANHSHKMKVIPKERCHRSRTPGDPDLVCHEN